MCRYQMFFKWTQVKSWKDGAFWIENNNSNKYEHYNIYSVYADWPVYSEFVANGKNT